MKVIKISMELVIDDELTNDKEALAQYLNEKLYEDPEFFGDFGPENIELLGDFE